MPTFRAALDAWDHPLVLYEVLPPHASAPREEVADSATFVKTLLADHPVAAINIPEVRNESARGARQSGWMSKMDPRQYGMILRDVFGDHLELIVNHPTVYRAAPELLDWCRNTLSLFHIANVVLVGGESSKVKYEGPGPVEGASLLRQSIPDSNLALGGIMIPTRRREGAADEPQRLVRKQRAGIQFFTSQVIFEPESTRALLRDYVAACEAAAIAPAPLFFSFAPITGRKDADFLEWLGVEIPPPTKAWILGPGGNPLDRSVRVAEHVLKDLLDYCDRRAIRVPIGINVEHVMRYNNEASEVLLDRLGGLLEWKGLERNWKP